MDLDMDKAEEIMLNRGKIKSKEGSMLVAMWGEMEVTIYQQGKVMFFPLSDKSKAVDYATDIIERINSR